MKQAVSEIWLADKMPCLRINCNIKENFHHWKKRHLKLSSLFLYHTLFGLILECYIQVYKNCPDFPFSVQPRYTETTNNPNSDLVSCQTEYLQHYISFSFICIKKTKETRVMGQIISWPGAVAS